MTNLILLSEDFNGHRQSYLNEIMRRCEEIGHALHIVTSENATPLDLKSFPNVQLYSVKGNRKGIFQKGMALSQELKSSELIVWEIERWYLNLFRLRINLKGIAMRPYLDFYSTKNIVSSGVKVLLNLIFSLHPGITIRRLSIPHQTHLLNRNWVDEIQQLSYNSKNKLNRLKEDKITFGVFGAVSSRKKPEECIKFAEGIAIKYCREVDLIIAGKIHSDLNLESFQSGNIRVVVVNEYLDDEKYLQYMSDCDYLLCFYENIGSARTPLEAISVGAKCVFLDSKNRWAGLEKSFPTHFIRFKNYGELEDKFANSLDSVDSHIPSDWIPSLNTWLDFLVGEKGISAKEQFSSS
jgi:hypothetical protein